MTYISQKAEELPVEPVLKRNRSFFSVFHNAELPLQWPKMWGQLSRKGQRHSTVNATTGRAVTAWSSITAFPLSLSSQMFSSLCNPTCTYMRIQLPVAIFLSQNVQILIPWFQSLMENRITGADPKTHKHTPNHKLMLLTSMLPL